MTYFFTLPRSFQPAEFLPTRLLTRADDARWLLSTIVRKTANRDLDDKGCVRLHSDILARVMDAHSVAPIVRALEAGGAIETTGYSSKHRSKGYRLARRFLADTCIRIPAVDSRLIARIQAERQRQIQDERRAWLPIHHALDREQQGLSLTPEADRILAELPKHTRLCQSVLVDRIRRADYPFSVSSTGRCFNAITGLKRELRGTLRLDDQPVGSVDLVNAQPALLAMLMMPNYPSTVRKLAQTYKDATLGTLPCLPPDALALLPAPDAGLFGELAAGGCLYEELVGATGLDRDTVKLGLLRDVLAKKGRYPSTIQAAFARAFPTVLAVIRAVNRHDHGELIRLLQRAESWLVVEQLAPRLLGKVRALTLHDALYSHGVAELVGAFDEVFDSVGFRLGLKVEHYAKETASD